MLNRFLLSLFLICLCAWGCDNEQLSSLMQVVERETAPEGVVQTELPPEVWALMLPYMMMEVESLDITLGRKELQVMNPTPPELVQEMITNGAEDVDLEFLMALHKDYYNRYIDADGIAIVGNEKVEDEYFIKGRDVVLTMTAKRPILREHLAKQGFYMIIYEENTTDDIPEQYVKIHIRGVNTWVINSCHLAIRDILGFCYASPIEGATTSTKPSKPAPMWVFAHEFAHALHRVIVNSVDSNFGNKLKRAYDELIETYGERGRSWAVNEGEFWAQCVVVWFYDVGPGGHLETREAFAKQHPLMAELLWEWFPAVWIPLIH